MWVPLKMAISLSLDLNEWADEVSLNFFISIQIRSNLLLSTINSFY